MTLSPGVPYTKYNKSLQKNTIRLTAQRIESSQGRYKTTDVGYSHESREIRSAIQELERSSTLPDIHSVASALCIITHNNVNRPHRTRKLIITKTNAFTEQYPNHPRLHHYNRVPYDSSFNTYPLTCPTRTCSSRLFKLKTFSVIARYLHCIIPLVSPYSSISNFCSPRAGKISILQDDNQLKTILTQVLLFSTQQLLLRPPYKFLIYAIFILFLTIKS